MTDGMEINARNCNTPSTHRQRFRCTVIATGYKLANLSNFDAGSIIAPWFLTLQRLLIEEIKDIAWCSDALIEWFSVVYYSICYAADNETKDLYSVLLTYRRITSLEAFIAHSCLGRICVAPWLSLASIEALMHYYDDVRVLRMFVD